MNNSCWVWDFTKNFTQNF